MRVAFQHTEDGHPDNGVAAYQLGRVQGYTNPMTGENHSADDLMVVLLDRARVDYPESAGYRVWPERLSDPDEDGESTWDEIDENALRARASGEPVEVPTVATTVAAWQTTPQIVAAVQPAVSDVEAV